VVKAISPIQMAHINPSLTSLATTRSQRGGAFGEAKGCCYSACCCMFTGPDIDKPSPRTNEQRKRTSDYYSSSDANKPQHLHMP